MSKVRGRRAAPRRRGAPLPRRRRGPSTVQAACSADSAIGHAAARLHDRRRREPRGRRALAQAAEIGAEYGSEVASTTVVERARTRGSPGDLVESDTWTRPGARGSRRPRQLVRGVGEENSSPTAIASGPSARPRPRPAPATPSAASHPVRAPSLGDPWVALLRRQRRGAGGAQAVELGPVLARELQDVAEALGGDERRAAVPRAARSCRPSSRGRGGDVRRPEFARVQHRLTAAITPSLWSAGVVGTLAANRPAAASAASVKVPPTSTPTSMTRRTLPPAPGLTSAGGSDPRRPAPRVPTGGGVGQAASASGRAAASAASAAASSSSSVSTRCWWEGQYPFSCTGRRWQAVPRRVVARHCRRLPNASRPRVDSADEQLLGGVHVGRESSRREPAPEGEVHADVADRVRAGCAK